MGLLSRFFGGSRDVSALIDRLLSCDWREIDDAIDELAGIGPPAIDPLLQALTRPEDNAAWHLGRVLRKIGGPSLSRLLEVIRQAGPLRLPALMALLEFEEQAAPAVPLLSGLLGDPGAEVRRRSALALGQIGKAAGAAAEVLLRACGDPDSGVRLAAVAALGKVRVDPARAVPLLARLAEKGDEADRRAALGALKDYGPTAREAMDVLIRCAGDPDPRVSEEAVETISEMGPAGADALPELARALAAGGPAALTAAGAVWKVARRADLAMPAILPRLAAYEEGGSPEKACRIICEMGAAAREAVPRLTALLACPDYDTLWATVDALAAIGPDAAEAIPRLIPLLDHPSGIVGGGTATALARIGAESVEPLREVIRKGTPHAREFAADALGQMGEAAEAAVPDLLGLLEKEGMVGDAAWVAVALSEITAVAERDVVDVIASFLGEHPDGCLRVRAAGAIGKLGARGRRWLPVLRKALGDDDPRVVEAARAAIRAIES